MRNWVAPRNHPRKYDLYRNCVETNTYLCGFGAHYFGCYPSGPSPDVVNRLNYPHNSFGRWWCGSHRTWNESRWNRSTSKNGRSEKAKTVRRKSNPSVNRYHYGGIGYRRMSRSRNKTASAAVVDGYLSRSSSSPYF